MGVLHADQTDQARVVVAEVNDRPRDNPEQPADPAVAAVPLTHGEKDHAGRRGPGHQRRNHDDVKAVEISQVQPDAEGDRRHQRQCGPNEKADPSDPAAGLITIPLRQFSHDRLRPTVESPTTGRVGPVPAHYSQRRGGCPGANNRVGIVPP